MEAQRISLACPQCGGNGSFDGRLREVCCQYCEHKFLAQQPDTIVAQKDSFRLPLLLSERQARSCCEIEVKLEGDLPDPECVMLPFWELRCRVVGYFEGRREVGGLTSLQQQRERRRVKEEDCGLLVAAANPVLFEPQRLRPQEEAHLTPHSDSCDYPVWQPRLSRQQVRERLLKEVQEQQLQRLYAEYHEVVDLTLQTEAERYRLVYRPVFLFFGPSARLAVDGHSGRLLYSSLPLNQFRRWIRSKMGFPGRMLDRLLYR